MKVFIFAFLFVFTIFTQAQEPTPPVDPAVTDGEGSAVVTTCLEGPENNITEVPCDFSEGKSCQTKFEVRIENGTEVFKSITRVCTQTSACVNNAAGNTPKCYPGENDVRQCFFCCETTNCNDFDDIPPLPL